ncbi:MAG TPA: GNAT family N-acetyltransferase [Saprospiraceae bacterium]|nr:GNAT family N-acetyltransferase [Saprospiraceae bacterium]
MTIIRKAQYVDLESIREMVVELAIFEREPDAVTATLADYQKLFKEGLFDCIVAEIDNRIIGIALYYDTFSTWKGKMMYLEDIVVHQTYRNQGIGSLLFEAFIKEAKENGAVLAKWQVLDWNKDAIKFYENKKAYVEKGWWNVKFNLK